MGNGNSLRRTLESLVKTTANMALTRTQLLTKYPACRVVRPANDPPTKLVKLNLHEKFAERY